MQIEVVTLWCLQIALLKGLSMPSAVTFGHIHVVHVDRHPHIGGGISDFIIHMLINEEVVGLCVTILNVIDTRLLHRREIELHVVIFEVCTPFLDASTECFGDGAVFIDAHKGCI